MSILKKYHRSSLAFSCRRRIKYADIVIKISKYWIAAIIFLFVSTSAFADGWLDSTQAGNEIKNNSISNDGLRVGGIANTRHNLTMSYSSFARRMDEYRNDYYEICVYCHTPHGANSTAAAPLWNRTVISREYTLYNQADENANEPSGLNLTYTQPGPNSLTCLSCHDGATAIDSIINMPTQLNGEFRAGYKKSQETARFTDNSFLNEWGGNKLGTGSPADFPGGTHIGLNTAGGSSCMTCHNPGQVDDGGGGVPALGPDFSVFSIGDKYFQDADSGASTGQSGGYLADDHPIGVTYPTKFDGSVDYNEPDIKSGRIAFFDLNGNAHADPNEIRLYDTGDGYEVECGSCHDPHGVKVSNSDSDNIVPSFLRVGTVTASPSNSIGSQTRSNVGSSLCLTCHVK